MFNHMSDKKMSILKELIFYKSLLNKLNIYLEEIASNGKYLQDSQIKSLDNIFRAIQCLERSRSDNKTDSLLIKLFDNMVKCICSISFIHSTTQDNDDVGQKFLLHTCTDYIYSHLNDQQQKQGLLNIRQSLLHPFSQWLTQQCISFHLWNNQMIVILHQLCFLLTLCIQVKIQKNLLNSIFQMFLLIFLLLFSEYSSIINQ